MRKDKNKPKDLSGLRRQKKQPGKTMQRLQRAKHENPRKKTILQMRKPNLTSKRNRQMQRMLLRTTIRKIILTLRYVRYIANI